MLKIGLIGAGFMGSMHAACYEALGCPIAAVADLRPEKREEMAAKYGCAVYETGLELIEKSGVDVIDICLPTYLHTAHALAAMEKVRAVFIEKPVALTAAEGHALLAAQKKTGAQVMVGQVIRLWDEYMWLKAAHDDGRYGKLVTATFKRVSPRPTWAWDNWMDDPSRSGTSALDMHIHDCDFIRSLCGEPETVHAAVSRDASGKIVHICSAYGYGDTTVFAEGIWDYPATFPFSMEFRVMFERATVVMEHGELTVYTDGGVEHPAYKHEASGTVVEGGGNISDLGAYFNELQYFTQHIEAGEPIGINTLPEAVKSLELVLSEIESAGGVRK
ncbi:MAG: Gfo/Idh/MocA family oxidoreductase [Clostridiaceae bacterium]|nr:Gfo/Idh/MocA family oxidoreductase [Clostridiaceae bacterium]